MTLQAGSDLQETQTPQLLVLAQPYGTGYRGLVTVRVAFAAGAFAAGVGRCAAVRTGFGSHVTVRIGLTGGALAAAVGAGAAVRTGYRGCVTIRVSGCGLAFARTVRPPF